MHIIIYSEKADICRTTNTGIVEKELKPPITCVRYLLPVLAMLFFYSSFGQYNPLRIPDTLSGTTFNLVIKDTFKQFRPGNQTITAGINTDFWGPTLFINKGDIVHMNVLNSTNDTTTIHWHGMHLPAVMDGGPHQEIPSGTLWQPYWQVKNNAAMYWYHPHMNQMIGEQITKGVGGFIIVRDPEESSLALPRTYGVDDIPLALTSRRFDTANQFVCTPGPYGDYELVNGTMNPQVSLPKQYVRLRILDAEMQRGYNLGFSDNRTFYVIGNDGGLLDAPVAVTRINLMVGERVELLVNLGSDAVGSSIDLEAYNLALPAGFPGGEASAVSPAGSLLNNINFPVLHINVAHATTGAITTLPATLVSNTYWAAADATVTRTVNVTGGTGGTGLYLDGTPFNLDSINKRINLNTIEQWTVNNNNVTGHSFHIHSLQFKLISRSSGPVGAYENGWKDTYYLPLNESVTFVARFEDYADELHPFMYHCHLTPHEDGGMMGQFVVVDPTRIEQVQKISGDFSIYPNPANSRIYISYTTPSMQAYYVRITNAVGRTIYMLPRPQLANGIDVSGFSPGTYFLQLTDEETRKTITKKFIKE